MEMEMEEEKEKEKLSYEECRRKRIEENKKRMEELNLTLLSKSLSCRSNPVVKPSTPMKRARPSEKQLVPVRRSPRTSNSPAPVYAEVGVDRFDLRRRNTVRQKYNVPKSSSRLVRASDEARAVAIKKAEELFLELENDHRPAVVIPMVKSHVSGCFWLGLPSYFCRLNMPKEDTVFTLVDEEGEEFSAVYLARKCGLSGGWIGFAKEHGLAHGDALIFQLIKPSVLQVYIIRANG